MNEFKPFAILVYSMLLLLNTNCPSAIADTTKKATWQKLPDMPEAALMATGNRAGDWMVVTGGINQAGRAIDAVRIFDLKTKKWKTSKRMSQARAMHCSVVLDDRFLLIAGGSTGQMKPLGKGLRPIRSVEFFDLKSKDGRMDCPPLKHTIVNATGHAINKDQAIIISGMHAQVYDQTLNDWRRAIDLRRPRQSHASVHLSNGKILIAGGVGEASLELLNPEKKTSTLLAAKLPDAVDDLAAVAMSDTEVWLIGGQYRGGWTTDRTWIVDLSDPKKATIKDGPRLQIKDGIADACVARVDHWIIVAGGESERNGKDTELALAVAIDTKARKTYALPNMHAKHDDAVSIATNRGMIIVGGYTQAFKLPVAVPTVEMFEIPAQKDD